MKLSVICLTYNHQGFIRQTLDGFVMQKTNFPFEVIVHDDASTDETPNIIREYEEKYPDIIKPIYQSENQWSRGVNIDKTFTFPKVRGEYVALCEGDDYWTDETKLQKQVDFLEKNKDYALCFHPVKVTWDESGEKSMIFPPKSEDAFEFKTLLERNFVQTNSVVYRWRFHQDSLDLIPDNILPCDWFLHLLHTETGKIGFIDEVMAVYRKHSNGVWYNAETAEEWFLRCGLKNVNFYCALEKHFGVSRRNPIHKIMFKTIKAAKKHHDERLLTEIKKEHPRLYKSFEDFEKGRNFGILFKLYKYKILSNLLFGKLKTKYEKKYNNLKTDLEC